MRYIVAAIALLTCAFAGAAEDANIAYAATVTATPKPASDSMNALVDGRITTGFAFDVGTSGAGTFTFAFDEPREVSGARVYQSHGVYYMTHYVIEADADGDGKFEKTLAENTAAPMDEWAEHSWDVLTLKALRLRCVAGESGGRRAHPSLAEFEIIGKPLPSDVAKASSLGIAVPRLYAVRAIDRNTSLVINGAQPAFVAPEDEAYTPAIQKLISGLNAAGIKPERAAGVEEADPSSRTVICIGNMLNNALIERLYWNRYTFADALVPGAGNYLIHTVYDPYPWSSGNNIIVIGCSDAASAEPGVAAFLSLLQDGTLPYTVAAGPKPLVSAAGAEQVAASKPDPTLVELTNNANLYLKTGCEGYAKKAVAAMRIVADFYAPGGERSGFVGSSTHRKMPWPEETSSWEIECAWDAFEECPLIDEPLRLDFTNAMLQFTRDLKGCVSGYSIIGRNDLVSWNHTTFPLLGIYFGARYFYRYYQLADMPEFLEKARTCFMAQAKSWKPQEDADSYLTLTTEHSQIYSLAENEMGYFEDGTMRKYADYIVGICDNAGLGSGFGDSGVSSRPNLPGNALPLGLWWTRDGGYKWLLTHYTNDTWKNPYERGIEPVRPDRLTGVNIFMTDPQKYEWVQTYPSYNEKFEKADVALEESFDKVSFRENWDKNGQYLLLDGISRGKHLHYDGNSIIEFVEGGERWLLDHDYLTRNTTEHTMLTVLRNGRGDSLVPSLSGLSATADLPSCGYSDTSTKGYNSCDWRRQILWRRGEWFLVADTVTAAEADEYGLELTWKTIDDAGAERVDGLDFTAIRGAGKAETADCAVREDETASGGKAVFMTQSTSRIAFGVDLPPGEYSMAIIGYGNDGSSDSLWVSVDYGEKQDFHVPKARYGRSASDHALTTETPKITLAGDGPHLILVTLRERPPIRVDRFIIQGEDGEPHVYEAEALPPAPEVSVDLSRTLHIKPAIPVDTAWVTNHRRHGIVLPVSILHQRNSRTLDADQTVSFASLMYVSRSAKRRDYIAGSVAPNAIAIRGNANALALLGPVSPDTPVANVAVDARIRAGLLTADRLMLAGLSRLALGDLSMTASRRIDLEVDLATGKAVAVAPEDGTEIRVQVGNIRYHRSLQAGRQDIDIPALSKCRAIGTFVNSAVASMNPPSPSTAGTAADAATKPAWTTSGDGAEVWCMKAADLHDGAGERVFVCRGPALHCLDTAGNELWSFTANSLVRDVAFGDLRDSPGDEVVVGSADTYAYILSAEGELLDKHQMRGMPWARSFGDLAYGISNVLVGDITGDGRCEILASMANFDLQALDADWKLLWKHDYALHGSMAMSFEDMDGDGAADTIFLADKYGSSHGCDFKGKSAYGHYTSIGDVCYTVADLDGDGVPEVVTASSTGDLHATTGGQKARPEKLWVFNNFGYPANALVSGDLDGKPGDEVVLASGTGYLYVLDAAGQVLWQDHTGQSVNDAVIFEGAEGTMVAWCEESGLIRVANGAGDILHEIRTSGTPRHILTTGTGADTLIIAGLAEGGTVAYPLR